MLEGWSRRDALIGLGAGVAAGSAGCGWPFVYDDRAMIAHALEQNALAALLAEHARRYPRMESVDVFKLLHQKAMGPGHLVAAGDALAWLEREVAELGPLPDGVEAVAVERFEPWRGLGRVHLRPYLAQGGGLEALARAFADTAARWTPDPDRLTQDLALVPALLGREDVTLGFDAAAWEAFTAPLVAQGLPAVHHSEIYRVAYAPAYRVVLVELVG